LFDYQERTGAFSATDSDGFMNFFAIEIDQLGIPNPCDILDNY
jgi:hypothetical protein